VICYSDGIDTKIVPFDVMNKFPILYDIFQITDENENKITKKDISLTVCPFTYAACVYEEKLVTTQNAIDSCLTVKYNNTIFNIINGTPLIKRFEVSIKTLRNVFTDHVHAKYIIVNTKKLKKSTNIHGQKHISPTMSSTTNHALISIPEKMIVHVIIYISSQTQKEL
jgi:hypothetical protein